MPDDEPPDFLEQGFAGADREPAAAAGAALGPTRDTVITRLAVLKAVAQYAANRHDVDSESVLVMATRWELWVRGTGEKW